MSVLEGCCVTELDKVSTPVTKDMLAGKTGTSARRNPSVLGTALL